MDRLSNLIGAEGGEVVAGLQQEIAAKTGELELVAGKDRAGLLTPTQQPAEHEVASSQ